MGSLDFLMMCFLLPYVLAFLIVHILVYHIDIEVYAFISNFSHIQRTLYYILLWYSYKKGKTFINNIHRLLAEGKYQIQVIVEFVYKNFRNRGKMSSMLERSESPVFIKENICTHLSIRREAIILKMQTRLVEDLLTMKSKALLLKAYINFPLS